MSTITKIPSLRYEISPSVCPYFSEYKKEFKDSISNPCKTIITPLLISSFIHIFRCWRSI